MGCHPRSGVGIFFDCSSRDRICHAKLDVIRDYFSFCIEVLLNVKYHPVCAGKRPLEVCEAIGSASRCQGCRQSHESWCCYTSDHLYRRKCPLPSPYLTSVSLMPRLTSALAIESFSQDSVRAMIQASRKAFSTRHLACRMSILPRRDWTFAITMEGRGGLKVRCLNLVWTPPCLPRFLGL